MLRPSTALAVILVLSLGAVASYLYLFRTLRDENPALGTITYHYRWGRPYEIRADSNQDGETDFRALVSPTGIFSCGGCGTGFATIEVVRDKKSNRGYLCRECRSEYAKLLEPTSIRNFWMCGGCGFRVLAGSRIDAEVDANLNACPECGVDVNSSLVNLKNDQPIASGIIGEPLG